MIKTGFKAYDEKCGGFPDSGLIIISGKASVGKSTFRRNLILNICNENSIPVHTMLSEEEFLPLVSNVTGIALSSIRTNSMTDAEKSSCKKFNDKLNPNYSYLSTAATHENVIEEFSKQTAKVLCVDTFSFPDVVSAKEIARLLSKFAVEESRLIILVEQEGNKASRFVCEHADIVLELIRADDLLHVVHKKHRDGPIEQFDFVLKVDFDKQRFIE